MKTTTVLCLVWLLIICFIGPIDRLAGQSPNQIQRELIIKFEPSTPNPTIQALMTAYNATELARSPLCDFRLWRLDSLLWIGGDPYFLVDGDTLTIQQSGDKARDELEVESAGQNFQVEHSDPNTPNGAICSRSFPPAGGCPVTVAVIDSGVEPSHPHLSSWHWENFEEPVDGLDNESNSLIDDRIGYDFYNRLWMPRDSHSHGTHVAGIIVKEFMSSGANTIDLMHLKAIGANGRGSIFAAILAIDYAIEKDADLINFSLGYRSTRPLTEKLEPLGLAIYKAGLHDILFICSAGNDGADIDASTTHFFPSEFNLENIISVAAVKCPSLSLASYSNSGSASVDVAAPGLAHSSVLSNGWDYKAGTSMAAAYTTGTAAVLATHCGYSTTQIRDAIIGGVEEVGLPVSSEGVLNGNLALAALMSSPPLPRTAAADGLENSLRLYPNPSEGPLLMEWWDGMDREITVRIHAAQGRLVLATRLASQRGQNRWNCPFPATQSGLFFLT